MRQPAEVVQRFDDSSLTDLFEELAAAMLAGPGGVGIAAPQIGASRRVIVVDCSRARRPCRHHGLLHLINPSIESHHGGVVLGREGCLSVPDWVGLVPRHESVLLRYQDRKGRMKHLRAHGFEARVLQHELDHLDGILFIDRVVSVQDLTRRPP